MKTLTLVFSALLLPILAVSQSSSSDSLLTKQVDTLKQDVSALKRIKVSGYVQAQFQVADSAGQQSFEGGNFAPGVDKRFMVRRGRLKAQYFSKPNAKKITVGQYGVQIDVTDRGFALKEAYARLTDPWTGWFAVSMGMFDSPFGNEVTTSSSVLESPDRGRMSQLHFPNEEEVGAMLTIQGPQDSKWNWLKWNAGFFNGNGGPSAGVDVSDFDNKKDFITRLSMERYAKQKKIKYSGGLSYYNGGFRIDSVSVYKFGREANGVHEYILDTRASDNGATLISNRNFTTRKYYGVDAQFSLTWKAGTTTLKGEYITGDQPGIANSAKSPNDKNPISKDIYARKFDGAYFYFIQSIMKTPFQVVVKYDWYDPNTEVEGNDLGKSFATNSKASNGTDVCFSTWGFGAIYNFDSNIKITAYYDKVTNETSENLSGYTQDIADDVFTLRMQVKF